MEITGRLVLARDVVLMPVRTLARRVREEMGANAGEVAVTRPNTRAPSVVIDAASAALLARFSEPQTIADAVRMHAQDNLAGAEELLISAFPLLVFCYQGKLLIPPGSIAGDAILPSLAWASASGASQCCHASGRWWTPRCIGHATPGRGAGLR